MTEPLALGDEDLGAHDVDAGDDLGDGVLDLDARVDFNEIPVVGFRIEEEFDGARAVVIRFTREPDGGLGDGVAHIGGERYGGRDFDDLLMAALDRTIAFEEVDDVAVPVAEDLHLDVARAADEAFEEDGSVAESGGGLGLGLF